MVKPILDPPKASPISLRARVERSQMKYAAVILTTLLAMHQVPSLRPHTSKFLYLLNRTGVNTYDVHPDDAYFVAMWAVLLVFIRAAMMDYVFKPIARMYHITSSKALVRFAEQGWSMTYFSVSFGVGLALYYHLRYWLDCDELFRGWPHRTFSAAFKSYYLIQIACWLQQIIVIHVEEQRKDHTQMVAHHIITCILTIGSYAKFFTNIGHVILVIMDLVDIFLSAAKMLKYAGYTNACDLMFIFFMVSWIVLRHGVYNYVLYHACTQLFLLMAPRHCSITEPGVLCYVDWDVKVFLWLLAFLQVIAIIWMVMIAKVAYKVISGKGAEDLRSDEDDTDCEAPPSDRAEKTETPLSFSDSDCELGAYSDTEPSSDTGMEDNKKAANRSQIGK